MSLQLRGSDSELSYASIASGAPSNPPGLDGRKRRTRGSSEDDEDKTYPDNFVNSDYRAGGPSLASVPVVSLSLASSSGLGALREDPHFNSIRGILADWGVDVRDYGVALRRARYYPEDRPIPTVCIIARKHTLDESWVQAALEIRAYLTRRGFIEVSVEIADQAAFQQALCFPVQRTDSIYPLWDRVCNMILGSFDLKDWRIVECFRYGYSQDVWANPPTIMVAVDRRATRRWNVVREGIVGILRHFGLGNVAVRISRGRVQLATDPFQHDIPETAFDDKAKLGISLGPGNNPYGSATFGGFVELLNRRNEWRKLGLTCYHAVLPSLRDEEKDSDLRKLVGSWNRNGVFVSDKNAKDKLYPMQPSERDMNDKLEGLQNDISRVERDKEYQDNEEKLRNGELFGPAKGMHLAQSRSLHTLRALKAKIEAFRANKRAILGTVFAASGFSTQRKPGGTELRHLDWALIKMPAWRMGDNSVNAHGTPRFGLPDAALQAARQPEEDLEVFKLGGATEWTRGRLNGLKSAHISTTNEHGEDHAVITKEVCVTGAKGPFSLQGDSGALVFDGSLRVVGMIFSGNLTENVSYITPCADLVRDIKRVTGALDVRIATE